MKHSNALAAFVLTVPFTIAPSLLFAAKALAAPSFQDCNTNLLPDENEISEGVYWHERTTEGPSPRTVHAMAYDGERNRMVLVGGLNRENGDLLLMGTWEWDGMSWEQVSTSGPTPRIVYALAYDVDRHVTVLFGGQQSAPGNQLNDTWEWDGTEWTLVATTGPDPREGARMVYDSWRNKVVLFGGRTSSTDFGDTWSWDGESWTLESTTGPAGRRYFGMAFDSTRGKVVLFGGQSEHTSPPQLYGDTWEWDGSDWQLVATTGPEASDGVHMVYDPIRHVTVMLRGHDDTLPDYAHSEVWEWNGDTWTERNVARPTPRYHYAMAYDSGRGVAVLHGGSDGVIEGRLGDTWEYTSIDCNMNLVPDNCETDTDEDGLIDDCDNCTTNGNPLQENFDNDEFGDACDEDIDNDLVLNDEDVCDSTPLGASVLTEPPCLSGTLRGDYDGDCDVDLLDYAGFALDMTGPY